MALTGRHAGGGASQEAEGGEEPTWLRRGRGCRVLLRVVGPSLAGRGGLSCVHTASLAAAPLPLRAGAQVVEVVSLNSLAYAVTSELGDIFEWCHKDDVEARLVVLSPGGWVAGWVRTGGRCGERRAGGRACTR